jgi:hypothetical protein
VVQKKKLILSESLFRGGFWHWIETCECRDDSMSVKALSLDALELSPGSCRRSKELIIFFPELTPSQEVAAL